VAFVPLCASANFGRTSTCLPLKMAVHSAVAYVEHLVKTWSLADAVDMASYAAGTTLRAAYRCHADRPHFRSLFSKSNGLFFAQYQSEQLLLF
jgi:hypothetical protein